MLENSKMGIYFINDPDGYWLEIIPSKNNKLNTVFYKSWHETRDEYKD